MGPRSHALSVSSPACFCHHLLLVVCFISFYFCLCLPTVFSLCPRSRSSKLSDQPFNLSIFFHGKKALRLIAWSVYYMPPPAPSLLHLLVPLASSPSVCVFPITFLCIKLLLLVTSVSSTNSIPSPDVLQKQTLRIGLYYSFQPVCETLCCAVGFGTQCRGRVYSFLDRECWL